MIKVAARFVCRDTEDEKDGLIIGIRLKGGEFLKAGMVYEVVEVCGEVLIKEVGKAAIKPNPDHYTQDKPHPRVCWCSSIEHIVDTERQRIILTEDEYAELMQGH